MNWDWDRFVYDSSNECFMDSFYYSNKQSSINQTTQQHTQIESIINTSVLKSCSQTIPDPPAMALDSLDNSSFSFPVPSASTTLSLSLNPYHLPKLLIVRNHNQLEVPLLASILYNLHQRLHQSFFIVIIKIRRGFIQRQNPAMRTKRIR